MVVQALFDFKQAVFYVRRIWHELSACVTIYVVPIQKKLDELLLLDVELFGRLSEIGKQVSVD